MEAVRIHTLGGADLLRLEEVPVPVPGPGQALLRVEAAGINYIDIYYRTGLYPATLPLTLGSEAAGTVETVGPNVTLVRPGDRVVSHNVAGAYAEYAVTPADRLVPLPDAVSARLGAAALLQGLTAHYLAGSTYPLQRGDTCLVHAAAGGLGLLLCQVARRRGARVIGTVSTEEKAALARRAGADEVIIYTRDNFVTEVKRITGGAGVQVVYDSVGRTTFLKSLDCVARRGMVVLSGQASGPVEPFDPQLLAQKGSLFLTRPSLGHYVATRAELMERAGDVLEWVTSGALQVHIGREYPLAEAAAAHRDLEGRRSTGKLLLIP